jgi:hypothetical protein
VSKNGLCTDTGPPSNSPGWARDAVSAHDRRPDPLGRGCRAGTGALRDLFYFYLVARGICFTKGGSFALSIIL